MLNITLYNLSVCVETNEQKLLDIISTFLSQFYTVRSQGFNSKVQPEPKLYASKLKNYGVYYLHTNQFIHLYHHIEKLGYPFKPDNKIDSREYKILPGNFKIRDGWELRDYQTPIMDFLLDNPTKSKLVPIQTGRGKTAVALYTIGKINERLGIVILPTYIEKWVNDIATIHEAFTQDVMVIQGSKSLKALIELAKTESLDNNYFIFSSRTMQDYITQFEEDPELCTEMYGCAPIDLFPLLGIGVMLVDESHQHFHAIFKILIYSNVKFQIGLSATLISDDPVVTRMHSIVYLDKCIYKGDKIDKYTDVYPIAYTIPEHFIRLIKTKNYGSNSYSHIAFEQSIIKRNDLLQKYIKLIKVNIDDYYIEDYREQDKLLIFVSTISLATRLTDTLKSLYPEFKVNRYCEDDPYENLMKSDIIVSTTISSGTAVDIPRLRVVLQTVSVSSQVVNLQSMGRLRKLQDRDVKFCYLYSPNIDKQKDYSLKRIELFKSRVANISLRQSRVGLF